MVGLDVLGANAAFIILWGAVAASYRKLRRKWKAMREAPGLQPGVAVDEVRRHSLRSIFVKYEDQRQLVMNATIPDAVADFQLEGPDAAPQEARKKIVRLFRAVDESLQGTVPARVASSYGLTGQGLFGPDLEQLERSQESADETKHRLALGKVFDWSCLAFLVLSIVFGIMYSVLNGLAESGNFGVDNRVLAIGLIVAWAFLLGAITSDLFFFVNLTRAQTVRPYQWQALPAAAPVSIVPPAAPQTPTPIPSKTGTATAAPPTPPGREREGTF